MLKITQNTVTELLLGKQRGKDRKSLFTKTLYLFRETTTRVMYAEPENKSVGILRFDY